MKPDDRIGEEFYFIFSAIFALYYCYWTNLNMFQTLRYLGFIGVPTFIFGNRLLSGIAAKRSVQLRVINRGNNLKG